MIRFYAEPIVRAQDLISQLNLATQDQNLKPNQLFGDDVKRYISDRLDQLTRQLLGVELKMTHKAAERMKEKLAQTAAVSAFRYDIREIQSRLFDEIGAAYLLALSPAEKERYEPAKSVFGVRVETKFASASFEIDEASKCMGLGRYTAAVFHLMRTTEIGLGAVRACLGIPSPDKTADRSWGAILKTIKEVMDERNKRLSIKPWNLPGDKEFFDGAYASLDAVKNAWRNTTMHVEIKYTEEEADRVFRAVHGFMDRLSERMDEQGQPRA